MDKRRLEELAHKWMTGTITAEEKAELQTWYDSADDGKFIQIPRDFAADELTHAMRIYTKIAEHNQLNEKPRTTRFIHSRIYKYAAAAILLIIAGVYLFQTNIKKEHPVATATTHQPADVKPPVAVNAIITLADGSNVILDSLANGKVALNGNVQLTKLHDGQIVYQPTAGTDVTYNTLTNPRGSKVIQVTLADGTRVWLNSESSIRYPTAFVGKERMVEV